MLLVLLQLFQKLNTFNSNFSFLVMYYYVILFTEEAAVMELLKFMYSSSLTFTTVPALLDVLMAADKFEVASCMKYCSRLLLTMPMTLDSSLLLLDLPPSLLMADSVKPLINAARQFIASRYKDISL